MCGSEEVAMVTTRQMEKRKSLMEKKIGIFHPKEMVKRILKTKEQWLSLGYKAGRFVDMRNKVDMSYAKFYTIQALVTFHWCVARMKVLQDRKGAGTGEISAVDTFREAVCQMFELSQIMYKPVVDGSEYNASLRLHIIRPRLSDSAQMRFFNGNFMVCLSDQDPLKWKVIRHNHVIETALGCQGHRNQKSTLSNIVKAPLGCFWKSIQKDVRDFVRSCGVCSLVRPFSVACKMGKSLLRDAEMKHGFSHISVDPLGPVKLSWGRSVREGYPLLIQCLTTKSLYIGLMKENNTKSIYNEILKCSMRFSGVVQQVYSDKGSNLQQKNLFGNSGRIKVLQNISHTQLRNVSESSTFIVKKLMEQLLSNSKVVDVFEFQFILEVICYEFNTTPFFDAGNSQLFCPIDGIIPRVGMQLAGEELWKNESQMWNVRRLAEKGKEVAEIVRKSIVESYLANPRLWKPKQFRNRNAVEIEEGDMVQIIYSREVGIVTKVRPQTVIVRKRGVEGVPVHKQNLRLIVSRRLGLENKAPKMESHDKTVFLSIPMESEAKEILGNVQAQLRKSIKGDHKYVDPDKMHCTVGLMSMETELQGRELKTRLDSAMQAIGGAESDSGDQCCKVGFLAAVSTIEFWKEEAESSEGFIVGVMDVDFPAIVNIRSVVEDNVGSEVHEKQAWRPHVTIVRKVKEDEAIKAGCNSINLAKEGKAVIGNAFPLHRLELRLLKGKNPAKAQDLMSAEWITSTFPEYAMGEELLTTWRI